MSSNSASPLDHNTLNPLTRPDRLALASWWHKGPLPPLAPYRFVQIGCGDGANLLPLAYYHPSACFIGVEHSSPALDLTRAGAARLGLENLELLEASGDVWQGLAGRVDYLLLTGQNPALTRERWGELLSRARGLLSARGIAVAAFYVRAGLNVRNLLGDVLRRLVQEIDGERERVEVSRRFVSRLLEVLPEQSPRLHAMTMNLMMTELVRAQVATSQEILAEYLKQGAGLSVVELLTIAKEQGLRYLGDAAYNEPGVVELAPVKSLLEPLGIGQIAVEETLDLLTGRGLRHALLCRPDAEIPPSFGPAMIGKLHVASAAIPASGRPTLRADHEETFSLPDGREVKCDDPSVKATLLLLAQRAPRGCVVGDLARDIAELLRARNLLAAGDRLNIKSFGEILCELHGQGVVELRLVEPKVSRSSRQRLHPLAQLEFNERGFVTTPYHTPMVFDAFAAEVARLLGEAEKDTKTLATGLVEAATNGTLTLSKHGVPLRDPERVEPLVREYLVSTINQLQSAGVLAADDAESSS